MLGRVVCVCADPRACEEDAAACSLEDGHEGAGAGGLEVLEVVRLVAHNYLRSAPCDGWEAYPEARSCALVHLRRDSVRHNRHWRNSGVVLSAVSTMFRPGMVRVPQ